MAARLITLAALALGCAANVCADANVTFSTPTAKSLTVPNQLDGIPFEVPTTWAGNLPIPSDKDESRKLFFWLWPSESDRGKDDLAIWLNGGPGCSSLDGALQENGPIRLVHGSMDKVERNPYAWNKLSHVMWVSNPVGVGFTEGKPDIVGMEGLADEFYGFLVQFFEAFPELKGKRLWLTGESYAGKYIPYIAHKIYSEDGAKDAGINLQGIAMNDPLFSTNFLGEEAPAFEYLERYKDVMRVNESTVKAVRKKAAKYGVDDYVAKHLQYPAKGHFYVPDQFNLSDSVWTEVNKAGTEASKCFNPYEIRPDCAYNTDPLGIPLDTQKPHKHNFINAHPGLKKALNVDPNRTWTECTFGTVFKGKQSDDSTPPDRSVLPKVIEKSQRAVIQHGTYDLVLIANGTALAIQNMTWAGKMGFENPPDQELRVNGKKHGSFGIERGLTFALIDRSGHMIPEFKPRTAFKMQKYLLGQLNASALEH